MVDQESMDLRRLVHISLFTAFIIVGGYLSIPLPLSPVPIVLADFFVMLAGLLLGGRGGAASVGLLILFSLIGLPVLAGGGTGIAAYLGPTGGYILGYLVCAFMAGLISNHGKPKMIKDLSALVVGNLLLYTLGVSWLKYSVKLTWEEAIAFGVLPFLTGMVIKIIVAVILGSMLRLRMSKIK
jgi:biotin transport system substrate-specific component